MAKKSGKHHRTGHAALPATTDVPPPPPPEQSLLEQELAAAAQRAFDHALALHRQDKLADASIAYAAALAVNPWDSRAANNLAIAQRKLGNRTLARALYQRALEVVGDHAATYVNYGNVLRDLGLLREAEDCHRRALALDPASRGAWFGLGLVNRDLKRLPESIAAFQKVLELYPEDKEARWDLAQSLLMANDYGRGWPVYETRWTLGAIERPQYPWPDWTGDLDELSGKTILIYGEQGFGDVLQFLRFLPLVAHRGAQIVLHVRPELIPLLAGQPSSLPGVIAIIEREKMPPPCDLATPLLSLPLHFQVSANDIPQGRYLAPPQKTLPLPPRLPSPTKRPQLKIALCWQGSPTQKNDHNRSLPFSALFPLLRFPQISLYSVQKGPAATAPQQAGVDGIVVSLDPVLRDFSDTAAALSQMDLLITADTSVLHLAGAMGKPVWVLLSVFHDWRFDLHDSISLWYPTARVFKQRTGGDWEEVVQRVESALEELLTITGYR